MGFLVVDRIERDVAVLIGDDGRILHVPLALLPKGLAEDKVLRVKPGADGNPDWRHAVLDDAEQERRVEEARKAYDELKRKDPGGDIRI